VADRIESNEILDSTSVGSVHRTTPVERLLDALPSAKTVVAIGGIAATFVLCVSILFSTNSALAEYRSGAWAILSGFAGACVTYFFGDDRRSASP
jgi:hypothetical protein